MIETNFGHADMWVVGNGSLRVHATSTIFRKAHDGVELATNQTGTIAFTALDCRFEDTENGLELAGQGAFTYSVDQCVFINCHNMPDTGGTGFGVSTGAIFERPGVVTTGTIRNSDFRNPAYGIVTSAAGDPLDMGTHANRGQNNFCIDFGLFAPLDDPYRVMLYLRKPSTALAEGNWWIRNNQGADTDGTIVNLLVSGVQNDPPPGPQAGPGFDRNFSIANPSGAIDFGTSQPAGQTPDCSVLP